MRMLAPSIVPGCALGLAIALAMGCGGSDGAETGNPVVVSPGDAGGTLPGAPSDAGGTMPGTDAGGGPDGAAGTGVDPTKDGPFAIAEIDATTHVTATNDDLPVHAAYPTGAGGPFPVVVFAHGFQIPSSQYYGYLRRLATFGFVAIAADYPASFTSVDNVRDSKNLSGALDWAASASALTGRADVAKSGAMGHSRGGKAAVLAATSDARFVAVLGLDPVDTKPPLPCDAVTQCPDARDALAAHPLPSLFVGETTDATAASFGQACAPADGNYATFAAKAASPSITITVLGANHMSFVEDVASCGFTCSVCKPETAKHADVLGLAHAVPVAFFEKTLRKSAAFDAYLDGAQAKALWVTPGLATITSK